MTNTPVATARSRHRTIKATLLGAVTALSMAMGGAAGASVDLPYKITGAFAQDVNNPGETFFTKTFKLDYNGGPVTLAGNRRGTADTTVDDVIRITVQHLDSDTSSSGFFAHDYSNNCYTGIIPLAPTDLRSLFAQGKNQVTVELQDQCGGSEGSSALWLTAKPAPSSAP